MSRVSGKQRENDPLCVQGKSLDFIITGYTPLCNGFLRDPDSKLNRKSENRGFSKTPITTKRGYTYKTLAGPSNFLN